MNRPRILILTASYGEGHNAAARAVAQACEEIGGEGSARVLDIFALTSPRMNDVMRRGYIAAINRTPRLWSRLYAWMDRSRLLASSLDGFMLARERVRLLGVLRQETGASVLCSTYPAYSFMLRRLKREGQVQLPHFSIVTDSISINSLWYRAPSDGWFVPNPDSADAMRASGVDPARIEVSGFPVNLFFARHQAELQPPDLAPGAIPRVLYIINSGVRGAEAIARRLLAEQAWDVTLAVGRDEGLRGALEKLAAGRTRPARILGWTDEIPRLLLTHHAVVSKAGGATTQEAIAARCPMIVNQVVPGQEEGNYELLRRHGIGGRKETPEEIHLALQAAFADGGRVWSQWRTRLSEISLPCAALTIARRLLSRCPTGRPLEMIRIP